MDPATDPLSRPAPTTGEASRLLCVLRRERVDRPPFWFMRQAGRYLPEYRAVRAQARDFLHFCYTPDLAVEATLQPLRRYGMDAAIIFSDILVIPDALGQRVSFVTGRGPVLTPIAAADDLPITDAAAVRVHLAPVYEALRRARQALPPEIALIGFAGAPWTIASYMIEGGASRDYDKLKSFAYGRPDGFAELIDRLVAAISAHLIAQVEAGADVLQLFDSWAGILPDGEFRRWCLEPAARIVRTIKAAHPNVPIIGFPRACGAMYEPYARETGVDAVSLDTIVPPAWARERLQPHVAVQGNLDPLMVVQGGAVMADAARRILRELAGGPFVFNLGHGMVPATPPDHVARLADLIRDFRL